MVREIIFFAGVALFLAAIWAVKDEKISRMAKAAITVLVLAGGAGAWVYESSVSQRERQNAALLLEFRQGGTLKCDQYEVTSAKFNYEFGTASFVAKREIKELSGVIVPIKNCTSAVKKDANLTKQGGLNFSKTNLTSLNFKPARTMGELKIYAWTPKVKFNARKA